MGKEPTETAIKKAGRLASRIAAKLLRETLVTHLPRLSPDKGDAHQGQVLQTTGAEALNHKGPSQPRSETLSFDSRLTPQRRSTPPPWGVLNINSDRRGSKLQFAPAAFPPTERNSQ